MLNVRTLCGDNEREHWFLSMVFCISFFFFLMYFFNHFAFKILNIFSTLKISISVTYMC